ncbi:MAG: pyridoxal phosphate-dependent aminotransferase [Rickettsiaceae bacterium]|nr:pyridoxal phosphate-dependent aminotransferase [Rickettsiaceae bacterium]
MSLLSNRLGLIKPSPTLAVTAKAKELKDRGINVISLGAGEPDFDTPDNIKQAAIEGINRGATKYTLVEGTIELREAICKKFKRENNLIVTPQEVIVSTGGKQVIYNLFMATLNENDEVIIPTPYWVSYPDIVLIAGGKPVIVETNMEDGFKPDIHKIEQVITDKTKWLILNYPSNPSGAILSKDDMMPFVDLLKKYPNLHIMSDDIYEHIMFDDQQFVTIASLVTAELKNRIFTINGVSKAYSMTGWRIGYGVGDIKIIKAMTMIQSQSTSNPSSVSQIAALEALNGPQDYIKTNAHNFKQKRDLTISLLNEIDHIKCFKPQGAFYLFPKCSGLFGKKTPQGSVIQSSTDLATYLLEQANVAVVPGIAFGMDEYFRISYATSKELLKEACDRMKIAINKLQ